MSKPDRIPFARGLRRAMTPAECRLWAALRRGATGYRFRRQEPRGPYTLDFVCLEKRLVIEVDGGQHANSEHDVVRDAWLAARGFRVMRLWNQEVMRNLPAIFDRIVAVLAEEPPSAREV